MNIVGFIDKFLVRVAFDQAELDAIPRRHYWYSAIMTLMCLTIWAGWMAVRAWAF